MSTQTTNYRFIKPDQDEFYDIDVQNGNWDEADAQLKDLAGEKLDEAGDASNVINTFAQATARENLKTGEKLSVSLGKLMRWFADLKTVAFSGKASDIAQDATHRMVTDAEKEKWGNPTKDDVGLGEVDNTSDADKPVSKAQQEALDKKVTADGGDIAATKVSAFTASTGSYPVPAANDTMKVGFGKIKKFFEDIRNAATGACFIGQIVNNCVTNNAKLPLSAAQGKVLMDLFTKLNSDMRAINTSYQSGSEVYRNKYLEGDTWSNIGPQGITLTPGYWLISYQVRIAPTTERMDCSIRSAIRNSRVQTVSTNDVSLLTSMELTEIVYTGTINNLQMQFYSPMSHTFLELWAETACIKLK